MIEFKNTTKIAIQAATAVAIAESLAFIFSLERSYWATLTALFLVSQTWGESFKKSIERIVMTIIGGSVGTLLYLFLPHNQTIVFAMLISAIFFSIYFIEISYLTATFFITFFVVFLFALIGQWNFIILKERIFETMIGAGIATSVSYFVFPVYGHRSLPDLFDSFINKIITLVIDISQDNISKEQRLEIAKESGNLSREQIQLRRQATLINYELIFSFYSKKKFDFLLSNLALLTHYVTSLVETAEKTKISPEYKPYFEVITNTTVSNLKSLKYHLNKTNENIKPINITPIKKEIIAMLNKKGINNDLIENYSYLYFLDKINSIASNIIQNQ